MSSKRSWLFARRGNQMLVACLMLSFASSAYPAGNLDDSNLRNDLVYDISSGHVQLEVPDFVGTGRIVHFSLRTNETFNLDDGFVMQGLDCGMIIPAVACGDETSISYYDPTEVGFEGVFELGRILPAGFSGPEVRSFLTEASYWTADISTLTEFDIHVVPEPGGTVSLLLGIVSLVWMRRTTRA